MAYDLGSSGDNRFRQAGYFLVLYELVFIALESERIHALYILFGFLKGSRICNGFDPFLGIEGEMKITLGADPQIFLQLQFMNDFAAA